MISNNHQSVSNETLLAYVSISWSKEHGTTNTIETKSIFIKPKIKVLNFLGIDD